MPSSEPYYYRSVHRKPFNFYSGPAMLPPEVLQQCNEWIGDFAGTGLSILEVSHRSREFVEVMEETRMLLRELMQLPDDFEVLLLHGGASAQFYMVPMNLLNEKDTAACFDTGHWAHRAMDEAKHFGRVAVACSSAAEGYRFVPDEFQIPDDAKYVHLTTNNTIYGTQLSSQLLNRVFNSGAPVVADMSSDILSRPLDYSRFALVYAGAQKNLGAAGVTIVALHRNVLGTVSRNIPSLLDYRSHIAKGSMYNTPPVFAVAVCCLTLRWLKAQGTEKLYAANERKAQMLYRAIDDSAVFEGTVHPASRSTMNVCFRLKDEALEESWLQFAKQQGIVGVKGHRLTGGLRASIYNAMPLEGVLALTEAMREFERTH